MQFQEGENFQTLAKEPQRKMKDVIVITDNRHRLTPDKGVAPDFRGSAFKETEIDPLQAWMEINNQHQEDSLIEELNRRLYNLEARIQQLEQSERNTGTQEGAATKEKDKKLRRKFSEIQRKHQCPFSHCARLYGSETSLKHHLKIKHPVKNPQSQDEHRSAEIGSMRY